LDSSNLAVFPACVPAGVFLATLAGAAAFPVLAWPSGWECAEAGSTVFDAANFSAVGCTFSSLWIWNFAGFFIALTME
jgi:hypothetical protein